MFDQPDYVKEPWYCPKCGTHNDDLVNCDNCGHTPERYYEVIQENVDQEKWDKRVEEGKRNLKIIAYAFVALLIVSNIAHYLFLASYGPQL